MIVSFMGLKRVFRAQTALGTLSSCQLALVLSIKYTQFLIESQSEQYLFNKSKHRAVLFTHEEKSVLSSLFA